VEKALQGEGRKFTTTADEDWKEFIKTGEVPTNFLYYIV
jgi:hypothetical protein